MAKQRELELQKIKENKELDEVIEIYKDAKHRIDCMKKQKEKEVKTTPLISVFFKKKSIILTHLYNNNQLLCCHFFQLRDIEVKRREKIASMVMAEEMDRSEAEEKAIRKAMAEREEA